MTFSTSRSRPPARRKAARRRREGEKADSTNVSMLLTALMGLVMTAAYYAAVYPIPNNYFRELFFDRGWVTVAETFLFFWSIAVLILKTRKLFRQREAMLLDVLPESLSRDITVGKIEQFAQHIGDLPIDPGFSFLVRRVLRGLQHFSVRRSASEVGTVLASQSDIDAHAVNSSYAMLNVFIWAIPILGFIGTVQGLGTAVGSLGVQDATDVESIKESLGSITGGLAVAFDTTLVALIMSLMLKFPASSLQKAEEDVLNWVDEYCNENLLKRLKEEGWDSQPEPGELGKLVKRAIDLNLAEILENTRQAAIVMTEQSKAAQQKLTQIVQDSSDTAARAAVSLTEHLQLLQQAVVNMNDVLGKLDGKQVVLQAPERPRRRWSLFGRRSEPPAQPRSGEASAQSRSSEPAPQPPRSEAVAESRSDELPAESGRPEPPAESG